MNAASNVAALLEATAKAQGEAPGLRVPRGRSPEGQIDYASYSFAEMSDLSSAAAHLLSERGIARGTRVLLMVRPGLELVLISFALFKLGAVPVIIDPGMGLQSFLSSVARSKPEALVGIPLAGLVSRVFPKRFRSVRHRVIVRANRFEQDLKQLLRDHPERVRTHGCVETGADELAAILFTSGSTGAPKGVCYQHGMFTAQVDLIRERYQIRSGEVDLPMLPIFALFNPALGMTTVVPEINPSRPATVDPAKIVAALRQNAVTNSFGSPVLWRKIARYCREQSITLPTIKRILVAGAPLPPSLVREFEPILPNGELHSPFGATEALPLTSIPGRKILEETSLETEQGAGTCVGQAFEGIELKVVEVTEASVENLETLSELPTGAVGEILATGPVVTESYDGLLEATAAAKMKDADGRIWHRMGDMGYRDAQGNLWFCGRKVERVQTRDRTLYSDCCEGIVNTHPEVYRSALIGLGTAPEQVPAIVIEPMNSKLMGASNRRKQLEKEVLELMGRHRATQAIKQVFFHKKFPVDVRHNAKIHRLTLKKHFERV